MQSEVADPDLKDAARIAYEGYCEQTDWKSLVTGAQLPPWDELKAPMKAAWEASAAASIKYAEQNSPEHFTFAAYEELALQTVSPITDQTRETINVNGRLLRGVLETMIQFGSDIDKIKKAIYYGKPLDEDDLTFLPMYRRLSNNGSSLTGLNDSLIDLMHASFGIVGEGCEMVESILAPRDPYAKGGVVEEGGDTQWYLPLALRSVGSNLAEAAKANNRKLLTGDKARYKSGAFSQGEALNRNTDGEIESMKGV